MGERNEPFLTAMVNGEVLPITRDNITLFRHLGANALYDHCLITTTDEQSSIYIWRHNDSYDNIAKLAEENQSLLVLNIPEPSDLDREMYELHVLSDLKDSTTVPVDWL